MNETKEPPLKPWKKCVVCGCDAFARDGEHFMRYGKGWFDCIHGHGFYSRGFNERSPVLIQSPIFGA